ncbi:hypothetical protein BX600DRAFT_505241 [Xylariales sp. PMI_506]|nr:hypothetical protein BX600DRAFT_505241 [Xylariales sp. PMI_506]
MANSCAHSFKLIKTDNTLIQWYCNVCNSGPHWGIYECQSAVILQKEKVEVGERRKNMALSSLPDTKTPKNLKLLDFYNPRPLQSLFKLPAVS